MKLQVIKTDKGYVAVDEDADIHYDEWCLEIHENYECDLIKALDVNPKYAWFVRRLNMGYTNKSKEEFGEFFRRKKDGSCKKIIATDTTFKLEGIPQFDLPDVLNGESVNLFLGYDEKSVQALVEKDLIDEREQRIAYHWFWIGLKAAQEKGCYTEEDLRKAINEVFNIVFKNNLLIKEDSKRITYDVIDSLKQPKQLVSIEVEETFKRPSEIDISNEMKTSGNINNLSLIQTPKVIKSEDHPDGLLTVKQYYYET